MISRRFTMGVLVAAYRQGLKKFPDMTSSWQTFGSAKVALKCESTKLMHQIANEATARGFNVVVVQDAGR